MAYYKEKGDVRTEAKSTVKPDAELSTSSISLDKDVAIKLVGEHAHEIDPAVEKRVLRKIDLFLIPAMVIGSSCPVMSRNLCLDTNPEH